MSKEKKILVVGAGLVGALWSIFLAKRGYQVEVYERRSDMRAAGFVGGRSINLAMSTRGWKAMEKAGIKDKIEAVAIPMYGRMMHDLEGDLNFQPYGKKDQAIYSVSRGGLNLELINIADSFENVNFHFDYKCRKVDLKKGVVLFEHTKTKSRIEVKADLTFGADGAFSAIRTSMQKTPRFNYSQQYLEYGYKELSIPPGPQGAHLIEKNALHIWPRGHFMLIALPNFDGSFTCTLFLPYEGDEGFDQLNREDQIKAFFEKHFPDTIPLMPELVSDFQQNPTGSLVTVRCNPWQYDHKFLLIGDASHAIVPFYGQGMNSGFEDCTILDELLDEYEEDWATVIKMFSETRPKDTNAIADLALRNFIEMRDLVADPQFLLRKEMEAYFNKQYVGRFNPLYSLVTFSHVPYSQALKEGHDQDRLFGEILALPGVEDNWQDNAEVHQIFQHWIEHK